jgi:mannose-6-phosphate isomerase-like protein (cupin superfamily)
MDKQKPVVIKPEEGKRLSGAFGGYGRRMLNDTHSKKLCMGVLYVDPGKSPHRWHSHDKPDSNEGFVVVYPQEFEEAYFIVQGKGVLQWKDGGEVKELRVETGDVVYFPPKVHEHQLFNDQETPMTVVYATAPPVV